MLLIVFVAGVASSSGGGRLVLLADFGTSDDRGAAAYRPSVTRRSSTGTTGSSGDLPSRSGTCPLQAIPAVVNAFVAAEDANFFSTKASDTSHRRAISMTSVSGGYAQGASTITQQKVKSLFLTPEKASGAS